MELSIKPVLWMERSVATSTTSTPTVSVEQLLAPRTPTRLEMCAVLSAALEVMISRERQ